ncbi:hypothetical protein AB9F26_04200 [Falsihalocynthiibacter sp. BN13B15]|uniref:hypothetical protein n=1 Tax=Falsihalocynthiibacter sp. BN13B15 TaxID=3240871 RepID=UPI00350F4904
METLVGRGVDWLTPIANTTPTTARDTPAQGYHGPFVTFSEGYFNEVVGERRHQDRQGNQSENVGGLGELNRTVALQLISPIATNGRHDKGGAIGVLPTANTKITEAPATKGSVEALSSTRDEMTASRPNVAKIVATGMEVPEGKSSEAQIFHD